MMRGELMGYENFEVNSPQFTREDLDLYFFEKDNPDPEVIEKRNELVRKVSSLSVDSSAYEKLIMGQENTYSRMLLFENVPQQVSKPEWSEWLKSEYLTPHTSATINSNELINYKPISYGEDGNDSYGDAILLALRKNGANSEASLREIFDYLYNIARTAASSVDLGGDDVNFGEETYQDKEGDIFDNEYKELLDGNFFREEMILQFISEIGTEDSIEWLIGLIKAGGVEFHKKSISVALSKLGPEKAAQYLLDLLNSPKENEEAKSDAGKILYRLELGKIGISEQGVEYLGRLYDVSGYNNSKFFAQRLTPHGEVGIFDETGKLDKYFKLGDLGDGRKRILANVLDVTEELLFSKSAANKQEEERRSAVLEEFKTKYAGFYNQQFFEATGLRPNNFSFAEQGWFLHFGEIKESGKKQEILDFAKRYGEPGMRTFMSLEFGDEMGDRILQIANRLDPKAARAVFTRYSDIIDSVSLAEEYILSHLKKESVNVSRTVSNIRSDLLRKARELLIRMSGKTGHKDVVDILRELQTIKGGIMLFASACKNLPEGSKLDFNDIVNTRIENKKSSALTEVDKQQMELIFDANRADNYPEQLLKITNQDFKDTVNDTGEKHTFRILKHEDKVVAFFHYDQLTPDRLYVGSLNLHPSAKHSPVAVGMIDSFLREHSNKDFEAVVWAGNPAALYYTRFLKFKKIGDIPNYHNTGETYWQLEKLKKEQEVAILPKAA